MKYMGGKLRIAGHISNYINNIAAIEGITEYYEPFMGGCAVAEQVNIKNRYCSDLNYHLVELFKKVQKDMFDYRYITREEWHKIKDDRFDNKLYPAWLTGWCGVACSFRGRYFEGYAGEYLDKTSGNLVNPQQQVYNSLLSERDKLINIEFSNRSYKDIGHPHGAIIYCDAPYRDVKQYTFVDKFNFEEYDKWLREMAKDNLVLISEYTMGFQPDFIQLNEWHLSKSIGAGQTDDESSIERLYYVKNGWLTDKYFKQTESEEEYDF